MTPTLHPSQRQLHITPLAVPIYVVTAIENPEQFASRYRNYQAYEKHIADSGGILYTVEVVQGNRHFEVTQAGNPHHIQLRANTEIWRKENLQNIGVARLPHDWQLVVLGDADFHNLRPDWLQATAQLLQRYDAVQPFSTYSFLKSDFTVESINNSFTYAWQKGNRLPGKYGIRGATGGQWAYRRSAWDTLEGMLETPILGSADWYMTWALAGLPDRHRNEELEKCAPKYVQSVNEWCERAKLLKGNITYLDNHASHYWHGPVSSRGYEWRWKILATYAFDPATDLKRQLSGLLELAGNKPGMRDEIRAYQKSRNEDAQ
jgi:hypothetical protein